MKRTAFPSFLLTLVMGALTACGGPPAPSSTPLIHAEKPGGIVNFPAIDDNLQHDTLLIQVTFDLGAGKYLMVASNVEEQFEGLRLYRYTLTGTGASNIEAISAPGYDSWTLLPTFFEDPLSQGGHVILANLGERNSWGQKVMRMHEEFTDLGFLDVALPERVQESDTAYLKLKNAGPFALCTRDGNRMNFSFQCDSLYLYDDLRGNVDVIVPAQWVRYEWSPEEGMVLWYRDEARKAPDPAT